MLWVRRRVLVFLLAGCVPDLELDSGSIVGCDYLGGVLYSDGGL